MAEYPFPVYNLSDMGNKLLLLDEKLTIDLNLGPLYISSIFDMESNNVMVRFNNTLSSFLQDTLSNIVQIIIYGGKVQSDVYIVNPNTFNRRTPNAVNPPTTAHDANLGYSPGSTVLTVTGDIYICTNNTINAAVWRKLLFASEV